MSGGPGRGSASEQRQRRVLIAELVVKHGTVTIEEIVAATGVSPMTVYRDLGALEEAGIVQRQRGTVSASATGLHEAGASFRLSQNAAAKSAMARVCAERIRPGSSVMLDDSTSGVYVIRELEDVVPLTVITNSLLVARQVERKSGVRLIVAGGEYQPWAEALIGKWTVDAIGKVRADFCVLSASGIADGMCFHPYEDVVAVKRAMMAAAETRVLLLDHTKFNRRALHSFGALTDFDLVVVDHLTPESTVRSLQRAGVAVQIAKEPSPGHTDEAIVAG